MEKLIEHFEGSKLINAFDRISSIAITDINGDILYANTNFLELSGYTIDELIGKNHRIFKSGFHIKEFYKNLWDTILKGNEWRGEIKNRAKNGSFYWADLSIAPIFDENQKPLYFIAVRHDITKKKTLEENKEMFFDIATHELKNPLTNIKVLTFLLKKKIKSIKQKEMIQKIEHGLNHMTQLITEFLDISKLESKMLFIDTHKINSYDFFQKIAADYSSVVNEYGLMMEVQISPPLPSVCISHNIIMEVISNIIGNAMRFAKKKIVFRVQPQKDVLQIGIFDDGLGIAPENMNHLFKKFSRIGERYQKGGYKSTGLGLFICKTIIEDIHKGKIWAKSQLGKGSQFYFTLPLQCQCKIKE